jgi:hypothetical protein
MTQYNKLAFESVVTCSETPRASTSGTEDQENAWNVAWKRTSGLEDILVQHMPCNSSDAHPRDLQFVREHSLRGDCEQDHVLCDRRREFRMVLVAKREAACVYLVMLPMLKK